MLGISEERFWESTPVELEPYRDMDKMMQERLDYQMWMMGAYVTKAVSVAVDNVLNGRKSRSKYLDKPFMAEAEEENNPQRDFERFSAWATVFNEQFKKQNGQG
jgi:hypothetical protein